MPRIIGPIPRPHPVQVRDLQFLRAHTDRPVKITVPGPFTMSQQAQNDHYPDAEAAAMAYAAAVNAEIRDLFAAGADIVQIDEPYLQARPDAGPGLRAGRADRRAGRRHRHHRGAPVLRLRGDHPRAAAGYSFLPELAGCPVDQISIETAQSGLDLGVLSDLTDKTIILGVIDLSDAEVETAEVVAGRVRRAFDRGAAGAAGDRPRLRDEVPAAGAAAEGKMRAMAGAAALLRAEL